MSPVAPQLGTPTSRSERDQLTFAMVREIFAAFGREVRKYDPRRMIVTGDSFPRVSAWHQEHEGKWTGDTPEQFAEMLGLVNPEPINAMSVHLYAVDESRLGQAAQDARKLNKPLFVGEFGAPGRRLRRSKFAAVSFRRFATIRFPWRPCGFLILRVKKNST